MNVNFVVDFNKPMYPCRQFLLKGDRQFDNVGLMSTLMTTFIVNVTIFSLSCCSFYLFCLFENILCMSKACGFDNSKYSLLLPKKGKARRGGEYERAGCRKF